MAFNKKEQSQTAGDNAKQTQIEHVENYNEVTIVTNHFDSASAATTVDTPIIPGPTSEYNISLWKNTLGIDDENVRPLRESYLLARENAGYLLSKIRQDFPNLTVHDITHVDSLWNVADTIIGPNYPINPLEGYILGIAFLIHDAALSYDAVGGIDRLRETIEWKDAYADSPGEKDDAEFKKECDFSAIRAIHAREAEKLLSQLFTRDNGSTFYIIDNDSYRKHFGGLIGKIAASHHWDIDKVESELKKQINPRSEMPNDWKINAQKLACILRCADAGHIDDGRAPDSIYQSLLVNGVSRYHWESQNHLCQVCEDDENPKMLCITSISPFEKKDFDAWNVAYDAIRLFDEELKKSNHLLESINADLALPHIGVSGATSKENLSHYVETDGWQPCNFGVHTSNIKYLIENLGGSKLYGEDSMLQVVLRELIQNARDAIHARQKMDSFDNGKITVRLIENGKNRIIEVEDNGIGMSMDCIKYNLLDFGSSYWKSSLSKNENPGLRSSGFTSVGKFGIGFYAVFMVANMVEVQTKRYNKSVDDAIKIEFPEGLTLSPIISKGELNASASTIVRLKLKSNIGFKLKYQDSFVTLQDFLPALVLGLDVDVYLGNRDNCNLIHRNITSSSFSVIKWMKGINVYPQKIIDHANELEPIKVDNRVRGFISIIDDYFLDTEPSLVTIGGLLTTAGNKLEKHNHYGYIGYLDFYNHNLSRDSVTFDEPLKNALQKWFQEKYLHNYEQILHSRDLAECFKKFFYFIDFPYDIKKKLIEHNEENISHYDFSKYFAPQMTIDFIREIHHRLYSGLCSKAGRIKFGINEGMEVVDDEVEKESFDDYDENEFFERIKTINDIPDDSVNNLLKKYILLEVLDPFPIGSSRTLGVWLNIMLDRMYHKELDWSLVDMDHYITLQEQFEQDSNPDPICNYLEQFLIDSEKCKSSSNELLW